jgi:predicted permease
LVFHEAVQDLRFAARSLFKRPGFTLVAVASLALGIGANTTIFTMVNTVFLNPLPVREPRRLAVVYSEDAANKAAGLTQISFPNYEDYRDQNQVFDGLAAWGFPFQTAMLAGREPEQVFTELVTGNYFEVMGIEPALGRFLTPAEDRAEGESPVAVMSHKLWSRRFGSDPAVVGRALTLNGVTFDVIGVAPEGFQGVNALFSPDLWAPLKMYRQVFPAQFRDYVQDRRALFFNVGGRLKPGIDLSQAQAQMKTIASALEREYPEQNKGRSVVLRPLTEATIFPGFRDALARGGALLMTVVGLVLLIACFNVANLLLAKASGRKKEIAVRLSLGAGRMKLVRQLLSESLLLGLFGGAAGLLLAFWAKDFVWSMRPPFIALNLVDLTIDSRVLLFTLVISVVTGLVFGLAPAIQSSRPNVVDALKDEMRTAGAGRGARFFRNGLVIAQMALSIVSLVAGGLFLRSLESAHRIDPGFETEKLAVLLVNPGQAGYDRSQAEEFYDRVLREIQGSPEVASAVWATNLPLFGGFQRSVFLEGQPEEQAGVLVLTNGVDPGYFSTLGTPLVSGRDFTVVDREGSVPVTIVNEKMAENFWPGANPLGRRFRFYGDDFFTEVVGVAKTAKYFTLGEDPRPVAFYPRRQGFSDAMVLYVRSLREPEPALAAAREVVRNIDSRVPITNTSTVADLIDQSLFAPKLAALLLASLGGLALALASVGLYGVMAYSVTQRSQEIGLRMALGAAQGDVLGMVLKQAMILVAIGGAFGLIASLAVSNVIATILFGSARDPLTFVAVPTTLAAVALVASLVPALRASRVDPLAALRHQ